jgi:hypothetical protein
MGTWRHDCYSKCWEWVHGVMMTVIVGVGNGYMAS